MTPLVHIAYTSEATVDFSDAAVRKLLEGARRHNATIQVTGMLLLVQRSFFQLVEGTADDVRGLFEKIERDQRHARIVKLIEEPIERRDFSDWAMGLARVTSAELAAAPGLSDFFKTRQTLDGLGEGMARRLLGGFRDGRWRSRIAD